MNNLKSMLSKSSPSTDTIDHFSIDDFFADVVKAANIKASDNYPDTSSSNWKTDANTFRAGASFALQWFSDKIQND